MTAVAPPRSVAVVGGGTMGSGIALAFALAGSTVRLTSRKSATLDGALGRLQASAALLVQHGKISDAQAAAAQGRVAADTDLEWAVDGADLVLESIAESLDAKHDLLKRAEAAAPVDAILATNTSSLSLARLAEPLRRPDRFAGFHWFAPAELVPLVEVVWAPETKDETAETLARWAAAAGKVVARVRGDVAGFIANRLQYALLREAYHLVESGVCDVADVDLAVRASIGLRWAGIGPFESMDLAGLDVHAAVAEQLFPALSTATSPPRLLNDLVADGALGCKAGRGLYGDYDDAGIDELVRRRTRALLAFADRPPPSPAAP